MLVKFPTQKRVFWCVAQEVIEVRVEAQEPDAKGPFKVLVRLFREKKVEEHLFKFDTLQECWTAADEFAGGVNSALRESPPT